ncbi:hypothetical protein AB0N05_36065 [Nocardia sp. NPDC051030]|uniref:hypothetical protein n=1 Tax=Nocardia sp. NPDC051030 TaxID=3155162 RepID=UPI00343026F4
MLLDLEVARGGGRYWRAGVEKPVLAGQRDHIGPGTKVVDLGGKALLPGLTGW